MRWNDGNFQMLRAGENQTLIDNSLLFTPNYSEIIDPKANIKDLGILVDPDLKYKKQIVSAVAKAKKGCLDL